MKYLKIDEPQVNWLITNALESCPLLGGWRDDLGAGLLSDKGQWTWDDSKWQPTHDYVNNPSHAVLLLTRFFWTSIDQAPDEYCGVSYLGEQLEVVYGGAAPDFSKAICMAFLKSCNIPLPEVAEDA